jgi:putative peptidoglycan lipid II flippase
VLITFLFIPKISSIIFPGLFAAGQGVDLVLASRLLLISPILLGLSGFFASVTQAQNRFFAYALSPIFYNIGIIIGIIFFLPHFGTMGLVFGVILGAFLHMLVQATPAIKEGTFPRLRIRSIDFESIKRVAKLSIPRTVTLSSQQITTLCLVSFASFLGAGSISVFNFALNLQSVPLTIIGTSYSSAIFPLLARLRAKGDWNLFVEKMASATRHIAFWSLPVTVLFIVLRAQIVRTILGSGKFDWSDTRLTAAALALFVVSAVGQSLILLFVRSFYAEGKTAKPLMMNVVSSIVSIGIGFILIKTFNAYPLFAEFVKDLLKVDGVANASVLMLPLGFSIGIFLNVYLHWRSFSRDFPQFNKRVFQGCLQSFGSSIIGGYVAYQGLRFFDDFFNLSTVFGVFMQGFLAGLLGIVAIAFLLKVMGNTEFEDVVETLKRKVWKVDSAQIDKTPV